MKNIAIILAGGSGLRLGADVPKQFLNVGGKMIIEYTIDVFHSHSEIDEIAIVSHPDYIDFFHNLIKDKQLSKVSRVLAGGSERYHSSLAAINSYACDGESKILFHDGVRPLVSNSMISECLIQLDKSNAVGVGVESTDTVWLCNGGTIVDVPVRENVFRAQTPQGFKFSTIQHAYEIALQSGKMKSTDDCGVVMQYLPHEQITIVPGHDSNIKITRQEDLLLFEKLLKIRN